jgi:hypothetical protein
MSGADTKVTPIAPALIVAPSAPANSAWGSLFVVRSASSIRLILMSAGVTTLPKQFRNKEDPYAQLAASIFGYEIDPKLYELERFVGQTGILGLGFGTGADKFGVSIPRLARSLKIDPAPGTLGATASAEAPVRRDCSSPPSQATSLHATC